MTRTFIPALALAASLLSFLAGTAGETARTRVHIVGGERHGPSAFPLVDYPETRPRVRKSVV